jgi:hypothetical protein
VTKLHSALVPAGQLMHYRGAGMLDLRRSRPISRLRNDRPRGREDTMGYEGSVWLVLALLALTVGLAAALYMATREAAQAAIRGRRTR